MTQGDRSVRYTYDANGMRISKVNQRVLETSFSRQVDTTTYRYVYSGGLLVKETITNTTTTTIFESGVIVSAADLGNTTTSTTNQTLYFTYDASGNPATVSYTDNSGTTVEYYYVTNLQGDVVAIVDSTGTTVVQYTYDAWGKPLTTTGSMSSSLGFYNPLRYRGYVYDRDTGLYYLQSRYYDPEMGRFINADAYVSTGQGVLGNNMFAYCLNNPILYSDSSGYLAYPGEIHNAVVQKIADKYGLYREQRIIYSQMQKILYKRLYGRADLISSTGEVWEVKRDRVWHITAGEDQIKNM